MLNMFRTLIHPSSGVCDFSIVSPNWSCVLLSMCVGVSFYAQHVSDINTSILRSLRLFYCITTLVVCSCFDVCWSFGVAGLGWYQCGRLNLCFSLLHEYVYWTVHHCDSWRIRDHTLTIRISVSGWSLCSRLKHKFSLPHWYHPNPATPKLQHTSKQEHTTNVMIQ